MEVHWVFCVVCDGTPDYPYEDLFTGRVAQEGETLAQLRPEDLKVRQRRLSLCIASH